MIDPVFQYRIPWASSVPSRTVSLFASGLLLLLSWSLRQWHPALHCGKIWSDVERALCVLRESAALGYHTWSLQFGTWLVCCIKFFSWWHRHVCSKHIYIYIYAYLSSIFKKSRSAILRPAWNRWSISVYYFSVSNLVLVTMPCVYQDIYSFQVFTFRNVCLHQLPPLLSLFFVHECKAVSWHINHREQSADREEIELLSQSWFVRYSNDRRGCKAV